ncbi:sodium-dependent serotonin transporter [Plakobranchus ocellatus]|uniref:Sodium-dependent serotonin transporter n=1 Tax=Plakobranchus ocellatus TaxID=259542 RepID=A0AAV3YIL4_9GAST|nr:sodium-dependent serotonin transporter [Plakobranchus ocellatus]
MQRPSPLLREHFRGSDKTLMSSSNNSSHSNIHTAASSSLYSNSNADLHHNGQIEFDEDIDDDDDDDGLELDEPQEGNEGVDDDVDDNEEGKNRRKRSEELESDKGLWDRKIHYILLSFGAVFGLRNVMEFPALAMKHGGGAFLFVYVILTYFVGLPIVYLEVSLGQYARGGVVTAWRIMPLARGIAISSLFLSLAVSSFSLTPAAWALYYLYSAMADWLPLEHIPPQLSKKTG